MREKSVPCNFSNEGILLEMENEMIKDYAELLRLSFGLLEDGFGKNVSADLSAVSHAFDITYKSWNSKILRDPRMCLSIFEPGRKYPHSSLETFYRLYRQRLRMRLSVLHYLSLNSFKDALKQTGGDSICGLSKKSKYFLNNYDFFVELQQRLAWSIMKFGLDEVFDKKRDLLNKLMKYAKLESGIPERIYNATYVGILAYVACRVYFEKNRNYRVLVPERGLDAKGAIDYFVINVEKYKEMIRSVEAKIPLPYLRNLTEKLGTQAWLHTLAHIKNNGEELCEILALQVKGKSVGSRVVSPESLRLFNAYKNSGFFIISREKAEWRSDGVRMCNACPVCTPVHVQFHEKEALCLLRRYGIACY